MRATKAVEASGVPAVSIVASGFVPMARALSRALGIAGAPLAVYDGVILTDTDEGFRAKILEDVWPAVVAGLRERIAATGADVRAPEPGPREIVLRGTLDRVHEEFTSRMWTDGLPIVPPTLARVEEFLRFTDRAPDEVIGVLPAEQREATVWSVAVNGVMAGCRPEYMPVLLAIVDAIADPAWRLEDAGSTPGWEPLVLLSGPAVRELGFNSGTGAMRVGRQANTSVGRFLRLYMINVGGFRIPPGETDLGAIASTFNVALAEDEEATTSIGWDPYRVDAGFAPEDSVVTVQSVVAISAPIYSEGSRAIEHFETIAELLDGAMGPWSQLGVEKDSWYPLLVLGPSIARAIASDGASKQDLQRYLYDNLWISARRMERYAGPLGYPDWHLRDLVEEGRAAPEYAESDDPDRLVRMLQRPEWTGVVVAGSPARNQSRAYINNHGQGPPVSRRVELRSG
jgi:hypothetical protein